MRVIDGRIQGFKAYDIRGRVPDELDPELARWVGQAYGRWVKPKTVVVGHDVRLSSLELAEALMEGLNRAGVNVEFLGQCGTEEVYFGTFHLGTDGGIMVTASHNPKDYNGLKLVREKAIPMSSDTGLREIEAEVLRGGFVDAPRAGSIVRRDLREPYIQRLLGFVDPGALPPLKLVVNPGNGCAAPVLDLLEPRLPFTFERMFWEPDGRFPNGIPNPLLPENRAATAEAVKASGASMGVAWDGDFDRCFFFDEHGAFVEGYYIVGLLARQALAAHPGAKIVHDPRLIWNTLEEVTAAGGVPVQCKSGHAFIKARMRQQDAVYGGEMSAHHYFRDFSYCDTGMVPWMLVAQVMGRAGKTLSELVGPRIAAFPASGEINRHVGDAPAALAAVRARYAPGALDVQDVDGVSAAFADWRFNLRMSNTEPKVRLNVESRGDVDLMRRKTDELVAFLERLEA